MDTNYSNYIALGSNNTEYEFSVLNTHEFRYKKKKLQVKLIEEDGLLIFYCDGFRYPVEIISQKQNHYEILVNGISYFFSVETPFSLKRTRILAKQKKVFQTETIKAPMPGKILNVIVSEGQVISSGEALIVLEAMKMQNILAAHVKGVVSKLNVKSGDVVGKDDLLLEIKSLG